MLARPWRFVLYLSPILLVAVAAFASIGELASLSGDVSLRRAPDSTELAGLLTAGTAITIVERRDGWVRARVEGWIPAAALQEAAVPQVPLPSIGGGATVEGAIRVKSGGFRNKRTAAGTTVFLLPGVAGKEWDDDSPPGESSDRSSELEAEAARLKDEADRAMREDGFTDAIVRRDALMARRARVLGEWLAILAARHGRHEARARSAALAKTTTDAKGWFSFDNVSPGTYTLYTRVAGDDLDAEWIETVNVEQGALRIDLDAASAQGLLD